MKPFKNAYVYAYVRFNKCNRIENIGRNYSNTYYDVHDN